METTSDNTQADVVVVARQGYQVLLEIGPNSLIIDCYTPVNLSDLFPEDRLTKSASLKAHLAQGNLIYYTPGQELPKDTHAVSIRPLQEVKETRIETNYTQKSQLDINNIRVQTNAAVTDEMRTTIQERVAANRDNILNNDKKLLSNQPTAESDIVSESDVDRLNNKGPLTAKELKRTVTMDVDPEVFKARQIEKRKKLLEQDQADAQRIQAEINEIEEIEKTMS